MSKTLLLLCLSLMNLSNAQFAANNGRQPARTEPFATFELIDARLSDLGKQSSEIKQSLLPPPSTKATTTKPGSSEAPWTKSAQAARKDAEEIRTLADRQKQRYASARQAFGVRAFNALATKASAVEQAAAKLARTSQQPFATKQQSTLNQSTLTLVLQFQAISGGYGAMQCSGTQQPCCEPKDNSQTHDVIACRWMCASSRAACKQGFTADGGTRR